MDERDDDKEKASKQVIGALLKPACAAARRDLVRRMQGLCAPEQAADDAKLIAMIDLFLSVLDAEGFG